MSSPKSPNNQLESALVEAGNQFVLGIDEVGRGAIAGPVTVGIAVLDFSTYASPWPLKLRDSKLISPSVRQALVPEVQAWLTGFALGSSSAEEIDQLGIIEALALAGRRAYGALPENLIRKLLQTKATAILDGSHNWLAGQLGSVDVITQTKADRDCAVVAAASVLAKVARDAEMVELGSIETRYDWSGNKGYASSTHIAAIQEFGPHQQHRKTWLGKILGDGHLFDF